MDYKHRIPFTRVDTIVVDKLMDLDFIGYQNPVVRTKQCLTILACHSNR